MLAVHETDTDECVRGCEEIAWGVLWHCLLLGGFIISPRVGGMGDGDREGVSCDAR